jgi:hypothetical protein
VETVDEHHEQRGRVDGSVVRLSCAEPERRRCVEANLVHDPTWFRFGAIVVGRPLQPRQRLPHAETEEGIDRHRHE